MATEVKLYAVRRRAQAGLYVQEFPAFEKQKYVTVAGGRIPKNRLAEQGFHRTPEEAAQAHADFWEKQVEIAERNLAELRDERNNAQALASEGLRYHHA